MITIIGAGPIGLAMAVRLLLKNIPFLVIEKRPIAGWNMLDWGHINLFSSWGESIDPISNKLLKKNDHDFATTSDCPTGREFSKDYLSKVATMIPDEHLIFNAEVKRVDYDPLSKIFEVIYSKDDTSIKISSHTVLDASGTWGNFNTLIPNQCSLTNYIHSIIPDKQFISSLPQASKIAVVGSGHSAMNSLIELASFADHELNWLIRSESVNFGKSKVGGKSDRLEHQVSNLIKNRRIELTTHFEIESITLSKDGLSLQSLNHEEANIVNLLISNIGSFPDYSFINGFNPNLNTTHLIAPTLLSKIDPRIHSCNTVSYDFVDTLVTDIPYYVIGMKSFGKASNFLLSKGYSILDELMIHLVP